jgi:hypothetical protein
MAMAAGEKSDRRFSFLFLLLGFIRFCSLPPAKFASLHPKKIQGKSSKNHFLSGGHYPPDNFIVVCMTGCDRPKMAIEI